MEQQQQLSLLDESTEVLVWTSPPLLAEVIQRAKESGLAVAVNVAPLGRVVLVVDGPHAFKCTLQLAVSLETRATGVGIKVREDGLPPALVDDDELVKSLLLLVPSSISSIRPFFWLS